MKFVLLFLLVLSIKVNSVTTDWGLPEEDNVIILSEANFESTIQQYEYILVEFYAPWCGHCQQLAPEYASAAKTLKNIEKHIPVAKIDGSAENALAQKFRVEGFPTLLFFTKGVPQPYNGGRTANDIVSWIKKRTGPSSKLLASADEISAFIAENKVSVIYHGKIDSEDHAAYAKATVGVDDVEFAHIEADALKITLNTKEPEKQVVYDGAINSNDIVNWVKFNQYPAVFEITPPMMKRVFGDGIDLVLLAVKANDDPTIQALHDASKILFGKANIAYTTYEGEPGSRITGFFKMKAENGPHCRFIKREGNDFLQYPLLEKDITGENIVKSYELFAKGELRQLQNSEPIPEKNDDAVKIVVLDSWKDIVGDTTKDVFVKFYAPWCGHCQALAPIWHELAEKLKDYPNIVITKIDATANDVPKGADVQGYPTLRFYTTNNKAEGIKYTEHATLEGLLAFIKTHNTVGYAPAEPETPPVEAQGEEGEPKKTDL